MRLSGLLDGLWCEVYLVDEAAGWLFVGWLALAVRMVRDEVGYT